jgi:hypothetical protein
VLANREKDDVEERIENTRPEFVDNWPVIGLALLLLLLHSVLVDLPLVSSVLDGLLGGGMDLIVEPGLVLEPSVVVARACSVLAFGGFWGGALTFSWMKLMEENEVLTFLRLTRDLTLPVLQLPVARHGFCSCGGEEVVVGV